MIIPVHWFRVPNAGLTRNLLENWVYRPARPACWAIFGRSNAGHLEYMYCHRDLCYLYLTVHGPTVYYSTSPYFQPT